MVFSFAVRLAVGKPSEKRSDTQVPLAKALVFTQPDYYTIKNLKSNWLIFGYLARNEPVLIAGSIVFKTAL